MLTIAGTRSRFCDRISRRSWLRIGGLALGGLALPEILRAEARSGASRPAKGIIMVLLPGGPSHLDMYDLKPDARKSAASFGRSPRTRRASKSANSCRGWPA